MNNQPANNDYFMKIMKGGTPITMEQQPSRREPFHHNPNPNPNIHNQPNMQQTKSVRSDNNIPKRKQKIKKPEKKKDKGNYEHFTVDDDTKNTVSKINKSIDKVNDQTTTENTETIVPKKSKFPPFLKEPMLLLTIYIILSLSFVKNFFGNYIRFINPDNNGDISIFGIIIYGSILSMLFFLLRVVLL
jgi:hypothetical protein